MARNPADHGVGTHTVLAAVQTSGLGVWKEFPSDCVSWRSNTPSAATVASRLLSARTSNVACRPAGRRRRRRRPALHDTSKISKHIPAPEITGRTAWDSRRHKASKLLHFYISYASIEPGGNRQKRSCIFKAEHIKNRSLSLFLVQRKTKIKPPVSLAEETQQEQRPTQSCCRHVRPLRRRLSQRGPPSG